MTDTNMNAAEDSVTPSVVSYFDEDVDFGVNNVCFFNVSSPAPGFNPITLGEGSFTDT